MIKTKNKESGPLSRRRLASRHLHEARHRRIRERSGTAPWIYAYSGVLVGLIVAFPLAQAFQEILRLCFSFRDSELAGFPLENLLLLFCFLTALLLGRVAGSVQAASFWARFCLRLPISRVLVLGPRYLLVNLCGVILVLISLLLRYSQLQQPVFPEFSTLFGWVLLAKIAVTISACGQLLRPRWIVSIAALIIALCITGFPLWLLFAQGGYWLWSAAILLGLLCVADVFLLRFCNADVVLSSTDRVSGILASSVNDDPHLLDRHLSVEPSGFRSLGNCVRSPVLRAFVGLLRTPENTILGMLAALCAAALLPLTSQSGWPLYALGLLLYAGFAPLFHPAQIEAGLRAQGVLLKDRGALWLLPYLLPAALFSMFLVLLMLLTFGQVNALLCAVISALLIRSGVLLSQVSGARRSRTAGTGDLLGPAVLMFGLLLPAMGFLGLFYVLIFFSG